MWIKSQKIIIIFMDVPKMKKKTVLLYFIRYLKQQFKIFEYTKLCMKHYRTMKNKIKIEKDTKHYRSSRILYTVNVLRS